MTVGGVMPIRSRSTGPADLGSVAADLEGVGPENVEDVGPAVDDERAVVPPLVGVADLDREGVELGERPGPGGLVHPGEGLEAVTQGRPQVADQLERARLGLGREIFGDVELAEGLADRVVDRRHDPLPAGLEPFAPVRVFP